jgi:xylulokinase
MPLVAGVDTSTQSCKIVIRDAESGELVRQGRASHPDGTEIHPNHWWTAFQEAAAQAGGLDDIDAIAVGGQQHGMVTLDSAGEVVRPALLWNDTRSAEAAEQLILEAGDGDRAAGAKFWAEAIGSVPVASLTVTKLRWLVEHEPENAARVAAVCLPHDWLSWRIAGFGPASDSTAVAGAKLDALATDRSDASGTGYWSPFKNNYRPDLLKMAFHADPVLPVIGGPLVAMNRMPGGAPIGPGAGDNAAAALGMEMVPGDVAVSIGTSGVVSAIAAKPVADATGMVTGFADASGKYLPLCATLNAARILEAARAILKCSYEEFDELALSAPSGADGLVMVPYLEGERTPNKPHATGAMHGWRLANSTQAHFARAAVEGLLCLLAGGLDAIKNLGIPVKRVLLIGGGAASRAVRELAPVVLGYPVVVPPPGEYVADGAARQAAAILLGDWPHWERSGTTTFEAAADPAVRAQYTAAEPLVINR